MGILTTVLSSHLRTPHLILRNIKWRMPRTISDQQVVFVVGAPRSGTTLLQRVLASHSALFSIEGETGIFSARNYFTRTHFRLSTEDTQSLFDRSSDIVDFFANGVMLLKERQAGETFVEKTAAACAASCVLAQALSSRKICSRHSRRARLLLFRARAPQYSTAIKCEHICEILEIMHQVSTPGIGL